MTLTNQDIPWLQRDFPPELLLPDEMATVDRIAAERAQPVAMSMARAGQAIAEAAVRCLKHATAARVAVLCGPGNNGGDGFVAARRLADHGYDVVVGLLGTRPDAGSGAAGAAAAAWTGATTPLPALDLDPVDLVVDALFGAGLARDLDGTAKAAVERLNAWARRTGRTVLAVDMPSGIDGASGMVRGAAVEATDCVTFFRLKPGHVLLPGRLHCGALSLADIGLQASLLEAVAPRAVLNTPAVWGEAMPWPGIAGHKYRRGHAVVVSGPIAHTGAARLAARGALRAGAGLVTVATSAEALAIHAGALTAIMTQVCNDADDLDDLLTDARKNAVVLGPGLGVGERARDLVAAALADSGVEPDEEAMPRTIVLDADALTSFSREGDTLCAAIKASAHAVILTPHDGEFAKLFGPMIGTGGSKLERARRAAAASGATVVLKGPDTVVAAPDGRAAIAASDAPWLATAGSGDVLAGMIAGLVAQSMPPFPAAAAAVWMHAEAARRFGPGLISEDIPEMLPRVLRRLRSKPMR